MKEIISPTSKQNTGHRKIPSYWFKEPEFSQLSKLYWQHWKLCLNCCINIQDCKIHVHYGTQALTPTQIFTKPPKLTRIFQKNNPKVPNNCPTRVPTTTTNKSITPPYVSLSAIKPARTYPIHEKLTTPSAPKSRFHARLSVLMGPWASPFSSVKIEDENLIATFLSRINKKKEQKRNCWYKMKRKWKRVTSRTLFVQRKSTLYGTGFNLWRFQDSRVRLPLASNPKCTARTRPCY